MSGLDLSLVAVGLAGAVMLCVLLLADFSWTWKRYVRVPPQEVAKTTPLWLGLVSVLSVAATVFSIHALLVVHGVVKR